MSNAFFERGKQEQHERKRTRGGYDMGQGERERDYVRGECGMGMNVDDRVRRCWVRGWVLVQGY